MKLWVAKQMCCTKSSSFLFYLNACVLLIDMYMCKIIYISTHMVHSFIIHRFFQCVFANCCYLFQTVFVHRYFHNGFSKFSRRFFHRIFQRCFVGNFLKLWSQVFSQGFSQAYFSHRFFHRVLNFEIFSKFRLCKIHTVFHRVFSCHRVFHGCCEN